MLQLTKNGFIQSVIDTASGRFLLLDIVQQNLRSGSYSAKRGKWLKDQLAAAVNTEVYLFMHHPPFDIGIPCQQRTKMSILLITHDLGVASEMADRVAVMYAGNIVEVATREHFFSQPAHPYSKKLLSALPEITDRNRNLAVIKGEIPSLSEKFTGCRFAERCESAIGKCKSAIPECIEISPGHYVKCHLWNDETREIEKEKSRQQELFAFDNSNISTDNNDAPLLKVNNLRVHYPLHAGFLKRTLGHVKAVDGISLAINPGKTLALVGESGCGKTSLAKAILRLIASNSGEVIIDGENILQLSRSELRYKRKDFQIIFQDPFSSLNPNRRIDEILMDGMRSLRIGSRKTERIKLIENLLPTLGLSPSILNKYPNEFSGGQRQKIDIARALSVKPKLLICDEPTSALDMSVQAQILNSLKKIQTSEKLAYLFITHNLSVVEYIFHEIAVMYLGRIVERGSVDEVLGNRSHPYTKALLSAVPVINQADKRKVIKLFGELPSASSPPPSCHFEPRCPVSIVKCKEKYPTDTAITKTHSACCYLLQ